MSSEDIKEIKGDIKELTKNVQEIALMHAEFMTVQRFSEQKIQGIDNEIYRKDGGILARLRTAEIALSNNKLRWAVLVGFFTVGITIVSSLYAMVVKPFLTAQLTQSEVAEKLDVILDEMLEFYSPEGKDDAKL